MMRSLWSAASGMVAQQTNVDTIANNLANVNTTGYKNEKAEFKTLLYQTLQQRTTTANAQPKPIGAQVGLGSRLSAITSNFAQGAFLASDNQTSFAISGSGFFAVRGADGNTYYTRNGDFKLSQGQGGLTLATSEGYPVLDAGGNPLVFPANINAGNLAVSSHGEFGYTDGDGNFQPINAYLGLFQFDNPAGLERQGESLFAQSAASGVPLNEDTDLNLIPSDVRQGYLEGSNVNVADEMINLIVAQRAYEMNSKAIQATDEMLGQANQLRR